MKIIKILNAPQIDYVNNLIEDIHLALTKYNLSEEDKLSLSFVQNKLQHLVSK